MKLEINNKLPKILLKIFKKYMMMQLQNDIPKVNNDKIIPYPSLTTMPSSRLIKFFPT
jgi:hypothetical protein